MLFILTDQHRVNTIGAYGDQHAVTPNLDLLAAQGTRFDRWFTPTAICTPARVSLLTGWAPFRHKVLANTERNVAYPEDLPLDQFTFSRALRDVGYNVGLVGKWHAGTIHSAADFGFDGPAFVGWHNQVDHPDYLAYLADNSLPPYAIKDQIRGVLPNGGPGNLMAARLCQPTEATFEYYLATRAIEYLERYAADYRAKDQPFFLALHFSGPHLPYILPDEYFDLIDPADVELPRSTQETFANKPTVQRNYSAHWAFDTMPEEVSRKLIALSLGYVALVDAQIGRVRQALARLGLEDRTVEFFSSDHGEFTCGHRLHDKGPAMYDDIYHTAGIIRMPDGIPGQVRTEFVSLLDCTATILDLAGIDPSPAVDSRSLTPLLLGDQPPWSPNIVCEFHGHHFPYPQRMIRNERYKLVVNPESINELYDLVRDPDELNNVYEHPEVHEVRRQLMSELYQILTQRGDNFRHWMTTMYEIGDVTYDPTMSGLDNSSYKPPATADAQTKATPK